MRKATNPQQRAVAKVKFDGLEALAKSGKLDELFASLDALAGHRARSKDEKEWADMEQRVVLPVLQEFGVEKIQTPLGTKGTVIKPSSVVIDPARLKRKLGAARWNAVSNRVLDKTKLERAIVDGVVDPVEVAECSEEVPGTVYIRVEPPRK